MNRKLALIILAIALVLTTLPATALGANAPSFSLSLTNALPSLNQDVRITINGKQLTDLYGYELQVQYDTTRLRFKSAAAHWTGLTVPASDQNGFITFAHTKLGKSAGENGAASIATLSFEAISAGPAIVKLTRVKLVDSKVEAVTLTPNLQAKINVSLSHPNLSFSDIAGHWAEADIKRAILLGFVNGYADGTFRPNQPVTRAEFTAMLSRAIPLPLPSDGEVALNFTDLDLIPEWAKPYIAEAAAAGIITGYDDHTFRSKLLINRAEMSVMIARAAAFDLTLNLTPDYRDESQIPQWAKTAVALSSEKALLNGRGNQTFAPLGHTTRAEALTVILKLQALLLP
ncbi:S-layer homology domain-containing protein [Paenibacillus paridis]|uniref:S-layer homology domain-containing protein n=1 Tax=Paenibacillus paridis TaxID=2583376 RepID=UPI001121263F|nr:S-layer homology domain-containing protein [Paenibacillus paridis]